WRPRSAVPRPQPQPFDRHRCLDRLRRVPFNRGYYQPWEWGKAELPEALSPQEAHFWLLAMTEVPRDMRSLPAGTPDLAQAAVTGEVGRDELRRRLRQAGHYLTPWVVGPLAGLLSPPDLLDLLLDPELWTVAPGAFPFHQSTHLTQTL